MNAYRAIFFILMLFAFVSLVVADDLYLKNGVAIRNVRIFSRTDSTITFEVVPKDYRTFRTQYIVKIDSNIFLPEVNSFLINTSVLFTPPVQDPSRKSEDSASIANQTLPSLGPRNKEYRHIGFLSVAAISFFLSYDNFQSASDIRTEYENQKKYLPLLNSASIDNEISRKNKIGFGLLVLGIVNMVYSLTPVSIEISSTSAQLKIGL